MSAAVQIDGYLVGEVLGRGGSATVYDAARVGDGRRVALKVLDHRVRRGERELAALVAIGEVPGVIEVLEVVETAQGATCLVLERMNESAAARLQREGPFSVVEVVRIGRVVGAALEGMHRLGVAHRDVKPGNVLLGEGMGSDLEVRLADFDIALLIDVEASTETVGSLTPPHAAPERFTGSDSGSPAADIWSLGSTLFTLLHGEPPFGGARDDGGVAGLAHRVMSEPSAALMRSDVPAGLVAVIDRCLAKDPLDRWASAGDVVTALDGLDGVDGGRDGPVEPESSVLVDGSTTTTAMTWAIWAAGVAVGLFVLWLALR